MQAAKTAQEANLAAGEDKSQLQAAWDSVVTGYDPLVAALERDRRQPPFGVSIRVRERDAGIPKDRFLLTPTP